MTTKPDRRGLAGVLAAQAVAWTGTRLSAIALPWFVLTTTGSAARTGLVVFAEMAPYLVLQVLSGPVIDRIGSRRISIVGDLVSMGTVALIPLLYAADALRFGPLLALVAVVGLSPALLVCGAVYLVTTTLPGLRKEWADMEREREPAAR
jgi:MFS family permease